MIRRGDDLSPAARGAYDAIIDVRSPSEFAEDHLPGAINLPVLDDAQRAEVGTLYVQKSKFLARRLGAAYVARNIATHLDGPLADRGGSFRPLVYCWRGGQRSGAMCSVMDQVGWPVTQLDGGYQTWRRRVAAALYATAPLPHRLMLLDGPTGVGKTALLARLASDGVQTIDLEALAGHRGSLFGSVGVQPSQKAFETALFERLERLDPARPTVLEAESSRVGERTLPPALWAAMVAAPRIALTASVEQRVVHILRLYGDIAADHAALDDALARLPRHHSRDTIKRWRELVGQGELETLVRELIEQHYDPAYRRASARSGAGVSATVEVEAGDAGLSRAAAQAAAVLKI